MNVRNLIVAVLKSLLARVRKRLIYFLGGLLTLLFLFFLAALASGDPTWAYWLFGVEGKFRALEFVGIAMGGVLLAIGAAVANRRAVAMERAAEAQAGAARAQADANKGAEGGRRQERLKNAIEHLGHESDSVRLGGAYELFHLAKDTEDLRQTVLDILCAHIRRTTREENYRERHKWRPSEEIQSLLTLLFAQKHEIFEDCNIHLKGSWLNGTVLRQARLRGAVILGAELQGASLHEAQLQGAMILGVKLQGASLIRTQLQGVNISMAQLQGASLIGAQLQEAYLSGTRLQGADLSGTQLQGAKLLGTQLQGAMLLGTQLQGASLLGAQLQGATYERIARESSFTARIRSGIGRESDLSKATFAGGLSRDNVDFLVKDVPGDKAEALRRKLKPHIGKPASHELPEGTEAMIGAYTAGKADRWIAEYEGVMEEASGG